MADRLTALIVGASRGLGLALADEWLKRDARVIATVRSNSEELKTLQERFPGSLEIKIVDVVDVASVRTLREGLGDRKFDVLFVNAGICRASEKTPSTVDEQDFIDMMLTNALGPMRFIELFEGLVPASGVLAVMSSELGSITGNAGGWELYSSSKAALNMLMKCFAARHRGDRRAMLRAHPVGCARIWEAPPPASPSKKVSRSWSIASSAVAVNRACASSTATTEPLPGDSNDKRSGDSGYDRNPCDRRQQPRLKRWLCMQLLESLEKSEAQ